MIGEGASIESGPLESSFKAAAGETTAPSTDYGSMTEYGSATDVQTTQSTAVDSTSEIPPWSDNNLDSTSDEPWNEAPSDGIDADLETAMIEDELRPSASTMADTGGEGFCMEDPIAELSSMQATEPENAGRMNFIESGSINLDGSLPTSDVEEDPLSELDTLDQVDSTSSVDAASPEVNEVTESTESSKDLSLETISTAEPTYSEENKVGLEALENSREPNEIGEAILENKNSAEENRDFVEAVNKRYEDAKNMSHHTGSEIGAPHPGDTVPNLPQSNSADFGLVGTLAVVAAAKKLGMFDRKE